MWRSPVGADEEGFAMADPLGFTYVVRHQMRPANDAKYRAWLQGENARSCSEIPELAGVRQYHWEKSDDLYLYFLLFYDFRDGTRWGPELEKTTRRIRESWRGFVDIRDFSAMPFEEIWRGGNGTKTAAPHPLIVERLTLEPDKEAAWNRWNDEELWPGELRDLQIAAVRRYRALVGDPRFYITVQVFEDQATMRQKILDSEPGPRPQYWADWKRWMPYCENMTRLVYEPSDGLEPTPRNDHSTTWKPKKGH